jgi:hypothetical protein
MFGNRSALYNSGFSVPFVNNPRVDEKRPGLKPSKTSEIKFTPIGRSPTDAEGSQVMSSSQEQGENSSHPNERAR